MAMTAGSVSIAADGTETKSGAASDLYDLLKAQTTTDLLEFGQAFPTGSDSVTIKKALAKQSNLMATWMVTYLTTNAQAKITTAQSGLQRTPNPNNPDTNTQAPSADKFLVIV